MKNLIIIGHPDKKSFCYNGIKKTIEVTLKENKEQTAVEQFVKRVESISNNRTLTKQESIQLYNQAIEQAKEMEKEQKATTWNNAIDAELKNKWESFEQFHNETYE